MAVPDLNTDLLPVAHSETNRSTHWFKMQRYCKINAFKIAFVKLRAFCANVTPLSKLVIQYHIFAIHSRRKFSYILMMSLSVSWCLKSSVCWLFVQASNKKRISSTVLAFCGGIQKAFLLRRHLDNIKTVWAMRNILRHVSESPAESLWPNRSCW